MKTLNYALAAALLASTAGAVFAETMIKKPTEPVTKTAPHSIKVEHAKPTVKKVEVKTEKKN